MYVTDPLHTSLPYISEDNVTVFMTIMLKEVLLNDIRIWIITLDCRQVTPSQTMKNLYVDKTIDNEILITGITI